MTVRLSPHKIARILKYYFKGLPQRVIAQKVGTDQSTISLYATSFRLVASEVGLLTAGKEFNVFEEVSELRSLSVELLKVNLTTEDAQRGMNIIKTFHQMGVEPEQHTLLIKVCKEVRDPYFVKAAIELTNIENTTGMDFHQAIERLQEVSIQLPPLEDRIEDREKKLNDLKVELGSLNNILTKKKSESAEIQSQLVQIREEALAEKTRLNAELEVEIRRFGVKEQEVKEATKLKNTLAEKGLKLSTLIKVAEEFPNDSN